MGPSLRRKEESSYAVLLMVRGLFPHMYALLVKVLLLCYLMGEVRQVQLYSEGKVYLLLVSAFAPSAIPCLGTL